MTGYLWYAWNSHRTPEFYDNANSFDEALFELTYGSFSHTDGIQQEANKLYIENTYTDPDKTDRSFYDVRLGGTEQPTPADLKWYYETFWEGQQLYPQMETTQTETVIGQVQKKDGNGNLLYEDCPGTGDYVKDFNWVEKSDGEYVKVSSVSGYESSSQPVDGVSTYYSDDQGATEATPKVGSGFYYVSGDHDVYTAVDKSNDAIGAQSQYYTKSGDTYTASNLMFNTTYYYPTGNKITVPIYEEQNYQTYDPTKTYYTLVDGVYTEVLPNFNGGAYYINANNEYTWTTVAIAGVTKYYQNWDGYEENMPKVTQPYYIANGTEEVDEYLGSTYYIADKNWYSYDQSNNTYTAITLNWYDHISGDYYYVSGSAPTYTSAQGLDYDATETYYTDVNGTEATSITFDQSYYYPVYAYSYEDYTGQEGDRYTKEYYYRLAENGETGDYCPDMEDVYAVQKGTQNDYRGWHQFILTAYATNDGRPFTPVKFYQTDNDWWTVCFPYDLRYSEMKKFFGNEGAIPYLSKLRYVVRDYDEQKITLMFSKNLMVYKEDIDATHPSATDDFVHGIIDDNTKYTEQELEADPIILHKGVPYLIKPNIPTNANRSFDVYQNENADLYNRLNAVQYLDADALETMIYKGEYTVPAYVIGDDAPESTVNRRDFAHADGPTFSYSSDDQITYGGNQVSAKISNDFSYTFVGSFFLSVMPQDCYFLGWDSKRKCAAFWYNKVANNESQDWNNQTGIICPNFNTSTTIHQATGLSDPARWVFSASTLANGDLATVSTGAKAYGMDWGGSVDVVVSGIGQINVDNLQNKAVDNDVIYDLRGVRMNKPLSRLTKGVYIVNGKKYVVD